jgi:hypothetical protein
MSTPYIPDDDRIDVIGKLNERLTASGDRSLREQAENAATTASDPDVVLKPVKDEGEKDKDTKEAPKEQGDKDVKEFKEEGAKDDKEVKEEGAKDDKESKEAGEKDDKEVKDEGDKDDKESKEAKEPGEKEPGEKEQGEKEPDEKEPDGKEPGAKEPHEKEPGEKEFGQKEPDEKEPGEKEQGEKELMVDAPFDDASGDTPHERPAPNERPVM